MVFGVEGFKNFFGVGGGKKEKEAGFSKDLKEKIEKGDVVDVEKDDEGKYVQSEETKNQKNGLNIDEENSGEKKEKQAEGEVKPGEVVIDVVNEAYEENVKSFAEKLREEGKSEEDVKNIEKELLKVEAKRGCAQYVKDQFGKSEMLSAAGYFLAPVVARVGLKYLAKYTFGLKGVLTMAGISGAVEFGRVALSQWRSRVEIDELKNKIENSSGLLEKAAYVAKAEELYKNALITGDDGQIQEVAEFLARERLSLKMEMNKDEFESLSDKSVILQLLKERDDSAKDIKKSASKVKNDLLKRMRFETKPGTLKDIRWSKAALAGTRVAILTAAGGELSGIFMEKFGGDIGSVVTEKGGAIVGAIKNYVSEIKKPGMDEALAKLNAADFKVDVDKGDGKTHIARKAFLAFQKNLAKVQPDLVNSLTKGQKIFVEDYLQKHGGVGNAFKPDQTVSISATKIEEAMQKALNLTGSEMKHLDGMLAQPEFRISPEVSNWMNDVSSPLSEANDLHLDQMVSEAGSQVESVDGYNGVNGALVAEASNVVSAPEDLTQKVPESVPEKENSQIWKYLASSLVIGGGTYVPYKYAQYKNRKDEELKKARSYESSQEEFIVDEGEDLNQENESATVDLDDTGEYKYPDVKNESLTLDEFEEHDEQTQEWKSVNQKNIESGTASPVEDNLIQERAGKKNKTFVEELNETFASVVGERNLKGYSRRGRKQPFKEAFQKLILSLGEDVKVLKKYKLKIAGDKRNIEKELVDPVRLNVKDREIVVDIKNFDKDIFQKVIREAITKAM